jgi:hypothetical protein
LKVAQTSNCAAHEVATLAIKSRKYAARLTRINLRVAPRKAGKANGLEPILGIANRVNAGAGRCHDACGRGPLDLRAGFH